jgi:hypothetical protein
MVSSSSPSLLAADIESYSDATEAGNQASATGLKRLSPSITSGEMENFAVKECLDEIQITDRTKSMPIASKFTKCSIAI